MTSWAKFCNRCHVFSHLFSQYYGCVYHKYILYPIVGMLLEDNPGVDISMFVYIVSLKSIAIATCSTYVTVCAKTVPIGTTIEIHFMA